MTIRCFLVALLSVGLVGAWPAGALAEDEEPSPEPPPAPVEGSPTSPLLDGATPPARAQALINYCAAVKPKNETYPKAAMAAYAARLLTNRDTVYAVRELDAAVNKTLAAATEKTAKGQAVHALDPFDELALMNTYLLVPSKIPSAVAQQIKSYMALYRHRQWTGYGAMNYRLMEDGAGYLAAQTWPDLVDADGLDAREIQDATKARLMSYCDEIVHKNFHEYGSSIYLGVDLAALSEIANFASDEELRTHAGLALDSIYTDIASSWNQGYYVNTAGRSKYWGSNNTSPDSTECMAAAGWIYFGGRRPVSAAGTGWSEAFWLAAPGRYAPPAILTAIAQDRAAPTEYRSSVLSIPGHDIRRLVCHFTTYSLASQWDIVPNPQSGLYKESRRMMLRWVSPRPSSTFIVCQENPRRPYKLSEHIANAFGYGENPFSQYLQAGCAIIGLCDVPPDYPYWKIYAPFPRHGGIVARMEKGGWIFCHGGSMLFAFYTVAPHTWGKPQQDCDVLWSDARQNGWILQTSELAPFAGGGAQAELQRFAEAILAKTRIDASHVHENPPRLIYTSLTGQQFDLTYRPHGEPYSDQNKIDGQTVDYTRYPLLDSPWVHQSIDGNLLTLRHGGDTLNLDFENWRREP